MKRIDHSPLYSTFVVRHPERGIIGMLRTADGTISRFLINHQLLGKKVEGTFVEYLGQAPQILVEENSEILESVRVLLAEVGITEFSDGLTGADSIREDVDLWILKQLREMGSQE